MNRYDQKMKELDTWWKRPDLEAEFKKPSVTLSETELLSLERELGHSLPAGYREFLRDYSRHMFFEGAEFPLQNAGWETGGVSVFFGVFPKNVSGMNLLTSYQGACASTWPLDVYSGLTLVRPVEELEGLPYHGEDQVWVKWPAELLPIADNGGNDETCLAIAGAQVGRVYYRINDPSPDEPNFYLVADSFDDFMQLLRPRG